MVVARPLPRHGRTILAEKLKMEISTQPIALTKGRLRKTTITAVLAVACAAGLMAW
jgi:hypothetical protein